MMKQPKKKNLLYIFADQWRGSALGFAQEEAVMTPNIDVFCEQSVYCDHTYSTFPLCSPHRASLLTGKYPLSTDFFTNCKTGIPLRLKDEEVGIGQVLKKAGYQTAYIGKWHLDEPESNHYDKPVSGATNWDAFTPPGVRRHGFDFWYSYGACDKHLTPHYWKDSSEMIQVDQWSVEHETDKVLEYLEETSQREKPFALYLSWNPPHSPYNQVPDKYMDLYRDQNLSLRPNVQFEGLQHHTEEKVDYDKEGLIMASKQYYAAISGLDEQFGRIITYLKETGLYEDTLVILSADHGDMMGSHGLMGKHVWYEEATKIPYIIHYPGCEPHTCKTCMGSQDMMPTILGMLDVEIPSTVEGVNCSDIILKGEEEPDKVSFLCACPGRDVYLQEFRQAGKNPMAYGWRGVHTERYTYVVEAGYHTADCEKRYLYDNEKDPLQEQPVDLQASDYCLIADKLEKLVEEWVKQQEDPFVVYQRK